MSSALSTAAVLRLELVQTKYALSRLLVIGLGRLICNIVCDLVSKQIRKLRAEPPKFMFHKLQETKGYKTGRVNRINLELI